MKAGRTRTPERPARRVSFSELLGASASKSRLTRMRRDQKSLRICSALTILEMRRRTWSGPNLDLPRSTW